MENPKNRNWKIITSEYLAREPWYTVRHECVELPSGQRLPDYYIFEYPDWVNILAITRDGEFVLIDQYRHGLGETSYEIPAGVIEAGEEPLAAAQRELMEETGFGGGVWSLLTVTSANPATQNNLTHSFLAIGVERLSGQHLDATEDIRVHLLSEDEVRGLLRRGEIRQALMAAPMWRYFCEKQ